MSIYLTAISRAKPQHIEQFKALLLALVVESRKEEACIQYDLHQSSDDPALFIFHEEWASKEASNCITKQLISINLLRILLTLLMALSLYMKLINLPNIK
ncbi:putative quinol monooxygenase [Pedobacter panaciterrae]